MVPVVRAEGRSHVLLRRSAAARRRTAGVVLSGVAATLMAMAGAAQWDRRELIGDLRADIHRDLHASGVPLHESIVLIQRSGMDVCRDFQLCVRLGRNGGVWLESRDVVTSKSVRDLESCVSAFVAGIGRGGGDGVFKDCWSYCEGSMLVYVRDGANDRLLLVRGGSGAEDEARLTADFLEAIGVRADEADASHLVISDR